MAHVHTMEGGSWQGPFRQSQQEEATREVEDGGLVFFPQLGFELLPAERRFLAAESVSEKVKNVSFDARSMVLRGSTLQGDDAAALMRMLQRYAQQSRALVLSLLPQYARSLEQARTSFRPVQASGRTSSWRKDDRRLHVDAFPSSPNQGMRLLRVFSNIHPDREDRVWRLGEPFEAVANRYLSTVHRPVPGFSRLLLTLGITKSLRSEYDHIMLKIHDHMKADGEYQAKAPSMELRLPPGSTWIVCTDCVSHAALSGQFMMEQTFQLPVSAMLDPSRSPLRLLERMVGRALV
jgi:hypothetical protein